MTILETFIQLRDDIKTWVTNNLVALNSKVDKINNFSGDYNDLTNKPEILENSSDSFIIADSSGNIILEVDEGGLNTTAIAIDGDDVIQIIESAVDQISDTLDTKADVEHNHDDTYYTETEVDSMFTVVNDMLDDHVDDTNIHITSEERTAWNNKSSFSGDYNDLTSRPNLTDDGSGALNIADSSGNVIVTVDENGINTTDVLINGVSIQSTITQKNDETLGSAKEYANSIIVAASKASSEDLTAHTSDKANPHEVTLAQLDVTATADELNKLDGVTTTTTELNYVSGVTSNIQIQLNAKAENSALTDHTSDAVAHITATERTTWNNKSDFSGDYNDLTNAPNITEDSSNNLVITDPNGNIIFRSDANGFETTTLTAQTVVVNGVDVETALSNKVDKEDGKGLSTNDYTTEEKEKLAAVEATYLPLSGGAITGSLSVQAPTEDAHAATKAYVDGSVEAAELFVVTIDSGGTSADKTFAEITEAYEAGRPMIAVYGSVVMTLTQYGSSAIYFGSVLNNKFNEIGIDSDSVHFYQKTLLDTAGGTMTGVLTLSGDPTSDLHATTKAYVDNAIANSTGGGFVAQDAEPTDTGVLWIDTANSNIMKFYNGSAWVVVTAAWGV